MGNAAALDAECYVSRVGGSSESLFVQFHPGNGTLGGWSEGTYPGGALELFVGASVELKAGKTDASALATFVIGEVRDFFRALPSEATLNVRAPEIPGYKYKASISTPFCTPQDAPTVARLLLALDAAASRPPPAGAPQAALPPVIKCWQDAGPLLEALSMHAQDAECYTRGVGSGTLFVTLNPGNASLSAWIEQPCPGGMLEQFIGAQAELGPGDQERSQLAAFVASEVRELWGTLPGAARLHVEAPEIPGDGHKLAVSTPFTSPEQAAVVARLLIALDEAARRRPPAGAPKAQLSPLAARWQAAEPSLVAMGMSRLDAECYTLGLGGGGTLFLQLQPGNTSVAGWVHRPGRGGALEGFLGAEAELQPREPGQTELAHFVASQVRESFGSLPPGARVRVEAPEIPGDSYKLTVTTPFTTPEQARLVANVLVALDEAAQPPL